MPFKSVVTILLETKKPEQSGNLNNFNFFIQKSKIWLMFFKKIVKSYFNYKQVVKRARLWCR